MSTAKDDLYQAIVRLVNNVAAAQPLVYIKGGSRSDATQPLMDLLPDSRTIGFEPDLAECARLRQHAKSGYEYFPIALGRKMETRHLYVTGNPACTSLLKPNGEFMDSFLDCAQQLEVLHTLEVETESLDRFLPTKGLTYVDFIDLDTQGAELEILQGAESFLSNSVLGLSIEVEFSSIYVEQPLFSQVDAFLRQFDFMLFDLLRYRYRRQNYPRDLNTRGQVLYGKAIYLRDYNCLGTEMVKENAAKLCMIAAYHGFHDYALEIIDFLIRGMTNQQSTDELDMLATVRADYIADLSKHGKLENTVRWLTQSPLKRSIYRVAKLCKRVSEAYISAAVRKNHNWSD